MIANLAQQLFQQLQAHLPNDVGSLPKRELHIALQSALAKLDLVTREEFDAQAAVLQRTRQKLELLEAQLATLQQENT
ncbi:accessory factor UbiK family protein [Cellvibrio japonicus]|uniref:Ubiquinone biosynthesis accessory factor UbiK n=1 Tax=Cellvibrio japonicus (strain Ueda107) TaxID=498211 RepID=B3PF79_CELJU|nr:accessory factor UbiK family protein [Cellvibrio japonicus]ACE84539.1 conserved hypothetical protein [Cellvibrio japonicus Ueda107]QEI13632.1 accessory factor UbiK family protein [Cellvibrio japonicus]QEI17205.1 accessory factor UbiK family protein [Cellvibrio japonicus]QEI20783.1 accessory factor UbiK family protein [Cellvibrio japonicus]